MTLESTEKSIDDEVSFDVSAEGGESQSKLRGLTLLVYLAKTTILDRWLHTICQQPNGGVTLISALQTLIKTDSPLWARLENSLTPGFH